MIVLETNRYAAQQIEANVHSPYARIKKWVDTTPDEMH